jgi:hypothetical protein
MDPTGVDKTRGQAIWINENGMPTNTYFGGVIEIALMQNGKMFQPRHDVHRRVCIDVFTDIDLNTNYDTAVLQPSQIAGEDCNALAGCSGTRCCQPWGTTHPSFPRPDGATTAAQGAGLLAIWDLTTDGDSDTNKGGNGGPYSGKIQVSSSASHATPADVIQWAKTYESISIKMQDNHSLVHQNWVMGQPSQTVPMLEGPLFTEGDPCLGRNPVPSCSSGVVWVGMAAHRNYRSRS